MQHFLRALAEASLAGGVFVMAAALVRSGVRHRLPKHFLVLLWAAVLLRLLLPLGAPSPTSIYNYVGLRADIAANAAAPAPAARTAGSAAAPAAPAAGDHADLLFHIWLAGAAALALYFAGSYFATRRRFGEAFVVKNAPAVTNWLKGKNGPPRVLVSDRTSVPLSYGLLRPVIVLPSGFDMTDTHQVESVLQHEYVHCRNYHNIMKTLVYAALALHWFNPFVWLFWFLFNHDLELACDEQVIRALGADRRAEYAHSLVAVAERAASPLPFASAFSARNLKERIVDVMGYKQTTVPLLLAETALAVGLFALFGTTSAATPPPPVAPPPAAAVEKAPVDATDPAALALSLTGGGEIVKHEVDAKKGMEIHEFRIMSEGREHKLKIDRLSQTVLKHESHAVKKPLAVPGDAPRISMDEAVAAARRMTGGGDVVECELKRGSSGRFLYEIELAVDGEEREVLVDAVDGTVLKMSSGGRYRGFGR